MAYNHFLVQEEYMGRFCTICMNRAQEGDQWGDDWTTDDDDRLYCAEHDTYNPTSDNFQSRNGVVRESPHGYNVVRMPLSPTQDVWLATDEYRGWFTDEEVADWPVI